MSSRNISDREAVALDANREELCEDIAFRFAKKSAKAREFGSVKHRYCTIARELYCLQPKLLPRPWMEGEEEKLLQRVAREMKAAKEKQVGRVEKKKKGAFLDYLERTSRQYREHSPSWWLLRFFRTKARRHRLVGCLFGRIRKHLAALVTNDLPVRSENGNNCIPRRLLSTEAMEALSLEWLRDPVALRGFLCAIFDHWEKISDPRSALRRKVLVNQISEKTGHNTFAIQERLQQLDSLPIVSGGNLDASQRNLIKQHLSRDVRNARAKRSRSTVTKRP